MIMGSRSAGVVCYTLIGSCHAGSAFFSWANQSVLFNLNVDLCLGGVWFGGLWVLALWDRRESLFVKVCKNCAQAPWVLEHGLKTKPSFIMVFEEGV